MAPEWERRETHVPGAYRAVYWQGALHVYNSDQLRMVGSPRPKDPSLFRVLVLGDSLTYGLGIEERFTYAHQLERLLRRRWRVEVVNAGIDGAQSEDIVRVARRLIPQIQPDVVIYGVCLNDFLPSGMSEYDGVFPFARVRDPTGSMRSISAIQPRGRSLFGCGWLAEQALAAAGMTVLNTDGFYQRFSEMSPMRVSRWEGHPNEEANAVRH
jgi:GDSL-like Lipase/Acylhydrolase family